jgi:hypothetical protein
VRRLFRNPFPKLLEIAIHTDTDSIWL